MRTNACANSVAHNVSDTIANVTNSSTYTASDGVSHDVDTNQLTNDIISNRRTDSQPNRVLDRARLRPVLTQVIWRCHDKAVL